MTHFPRLSLRRSVYSFVFVTMAVVAIVLAILLQSGASRLTDSTLGTGLRTRTTSAATDLARTLESDWRNLSSLSEQAADLDPATLTLMMAGMRGDGTRISWLGFAATSGQVVAASDDLLLGEDVSSRPWFRSGLSGGFAGDVHEALLLAQLLGGNRTEPLRFIDLARPVSGTNGEVAGVLGMHINHDWLAAYLRDSAGVLGIDLYLISPSGEVAASSTGEMPDPTELQILRAAQTGTQQGQREVWPNGGEYLATVVTQISYGDLPNFGWRMVGRLDPTPYDPGIVLMRHGGLKAVLVALLIVLACTFVYVRIFVAPIVALARSADRIADGSEEYPAVSAATREVAQLSSALTRLQQDQVSADQS